MSVSAHPFEPLAPYAIWTAADADTWRGGAPRSAVILDANRRPTAIVTRSEEIADLPVHARYALVGTQAVSLRGALATRDISVLDAWPPPAGPALGEVAQRLLAVLDIAAQAVPEGVIVGIGGLHGNDDDGELGMRPLDGAHPFDVLTAFDAPAEWDAIGVVCNGRTISLARSTAPARSTAAPGSTPPARSTAAPGSTPPAKPVNQRLLVANFVTRDNREIGWTERNGERTVHHDCALGRVPDALRRALGLATPPPAAPTDVLFAQQWLHDVAALECRVWSEAAELHPATRMLVLGEDNLVEAAGALGRVCGWDDVRDQIATAKWQYQDVEARTAAWMDAGMLSRELIGHEPSMKLYLEHVRRRCGDPIAKQAKRVLADLGIAESDLRRWRSG